MKKSVFALSFLFLSSLLLTACGSQTPASSAPVSSTPASSPSASSEVSPLVKEKGVEFYRTATVHGAGSLYFEDAMPEVPFIALEEARALLGQSGLDPNSSAYAIT